MIHFTVGDVMDAVEPRWSAGVDRTVHVPAICTPRHWRKPAKVRRGCATSRITAAWCSIINPGANNSSTGGGVTALLDCR